MSAPVSFTRARPLANHCPQLFARGGAADPVGERLSDLGARVAVRLASQLHLFFGQAARVTCAEAETVTPRDFLAPRAAASALIALPEATGTIAGAITGGDLATVTDRLFGGEGALAVAFADDLPLTARLVAERLHAMLATALGQAVDPGGGSQAVSRALDHGDTPPMGQDPWDVLAFTVELPGSPSWTIRLAACAMARQTLFRDPAPEGRGASLALRAVAAVTAVPIELRAVVAELPLPLARLSRLRPSDLVPFAMPPAVSLRIGDTPFAAGTAGAVDGQASLRLSRVS